MDMRDRIQAEMDRQGLNRAELARRAGLNLTYIRDLLENPQQDPKLSKIQALAHALGKSIQWLVDGVEPSGTARLLDRLDEASRAEVEAFARFKAQQQKDKA